MKVNDNGFTERVATAAPSAPASGSTANGRYALVSQTTESGDDVQLSGFAARLNDGVNTEASNRTDHLNKVANAVNSGAFRIDTAAVSRSIVSEALQSQG
jgi:hypothetical protein